MNTSEHMSADKDEEQWVHPLLLGKHKQPNPFGKCSSTFSNEGQHERPHGPAIPLLTLRPRDGVYIASGEWTSRFRAASHAIAKKTKTKQPTCPSPEEWKIHCVVSKGQTAVHQGQRRTYTYYYLQQYRGSLQTWCWREQQIPENRMQFHVLFHEVQK